MSRNKHHNDWKRELEEEETLTRKELEELVRLEKLETISRREIEEDLIECEAELKKDIFNDGKVTQFIGNRDDILDNYYDLDDYVENL